MPIRTVLIGTVASAAVIIAAVAIVTISGAYNFAADAPHTSFVRKLIALARERSIEVRSSGIRVPPLNDPSMIVEGAEHYSAMCTGCHLAPGLPENEMRPGMNPKPPVLASLAPEPPAEQFWVIKHGLKMTAMPAWGSTHTDEEIWNMVALLQRLPRMSAQQYRALVARSGGHHKHDDMDMPH